MPNTDFKLGDCSYLDSCRHLETCKYVHYQVDPADLQRLFFKMQRSQSYASAEEPERKIWTEFKPLQIDFAKERELRIQRLRNSGKAQWINCDLQGVDLGRLVHAEAGSAYFDALVVDPPWDIHMSLPYETLSDQQMVANMKGIEKLQTAGGLIFLWVTARAIELGIECLDKWGYTVVEELVWLKVNQLGRLIRTGMTGHWLNHTKEHCIVAVKSDDSNGGSLPDDFVESLRLKVDQDIIVSEVRETSRKPDELYLIIDRLLGAKAQPARKLEIFARENNLREGWLSIGNQLPGTHLLEQDLKAYFP